MRGEVQLVFPAEVVKRQTQQLQGLPPARAWGFKSPLRHCYRRISVFVYQSSTFHRRSLGVVIGMIRRPCTRSLWAYR